jgi:ATP-binding cassette, subfamily B, multidrug efflux pump
MENARKKKVFDVSVLRRVFHFVKPYRKAFYLSLFMAVLMAAFAPIRPFLIQLTVNSAFLNNVHSPSWLNFFLFGEQLKGVGNFIIAVSIFQVAFLFIETAVRFGFSLLRGWDKTW